MTSRAEPVRAAEVVPLGLATFALSKLLPKRASPGCAHVRTPAPHHLRLPMANARASRA